MLIIDALRARSQVIDIAESRLAKTQRNALSNRRSTNINWQYDNADNLQGAFCDGVWFGKDELLALDDRVMSVPRWPRRGESRRFHAASCHVRGANVCFVWVCW